MPASDRRAQLLDAALTLFSLRGYDRTTTKEIAATAGVTEAIVFRHFPSKQALYQAVLDQHSDQPRFRSWMDCIREHIDRNNDEGLMRAIAEAVLEPYRCDPRMQRVMLFAALEGQEIALNHFRSVTTPIYEFLREYILRRQREGAIIPIHPAAILTAIAGMAQYHAHSTRLFGYESEFSDEQAVENFTRILMGGITPGVAR